MLKTLNKAMNLGSIWLFPPPGGKVEPMNYKEYFYHFR